jgi:putative nucleotidyltransferase with HDIG domain
MKKNDSDFLEQITAEHPVDLLYALNNVATALQQSIQLEDNIYRVFHEQVVSLGLRGGISLLDEQGETLRFRTIAFTNPLRKILSRFENNLKLKAEGFEVLVDQVDVYQKVIKDGQTEFVNDTSSVSAQVVPSQIRNVIAPLLSFLGSPPGIFTPLIFNGEIKGMLNIVGQNLTDKDIPAVRAFSNQIAVALENSRLVERLIFAKKELDTAYQSTLEGWVQALDLRDQETEGHTLRVAEATVRLAKHMGMPEADIPHIRRGALLHDIGKMAIPDNILRKPGPLTEDEWRVMKKHPIYAYQWLSQIEYLKPALDIPYCHHERLDGSGYPRGLSGEEIPLSARIFSVVDVWDAMTSDRPYRKRMPKEEVTNYIKGQAGTYFDEQAVWNFFDLKKKEPNF